MVRFQVKSNQKLKKFLALFLLFKGELRSSEAIYHKIYHKILRLLQKKTNSLRFIVLMKSAKNLREPQV